MPPRQPHSPVPPPFPSLPPGPPITTHLGGVREKKENENPRVSKLPPILGRRRVAIEDDSTFPPAFPALAVPPSILFLPIPPYPLPPSFFLPPLAEWPSDGLWRTRTRTRVTKWRWPSPPVPVRRRTTGLRFSPGLAARPLWGERKRRGRGEWMDRWAQLGSHVHTDRPASSAFRYMPRIAYARKGVRVNRLP